MKRYVLLIKLLKCFLSKLLAILINGIFLQKGPLCSEVVVGQGNTTAWKMCGLDKSSTFCLIFEVAKKESPDAIAQSANPQFYFQFLT